MARLKYDLFNRGCSFLFKCIAYFILQPILISLKGEIKPKTVVRLKSYLPLLSETAINAGKLFRNIGADCAACNGLCCGGGFDRFTLFDHITDVISGAREYRRWGYRLTPINMHKANFARMNEKCAYMGPDGCKLPYPERPIIICVMDYCGKMSKLMTNNQKIELINLRHKFYKVFFMYTVHLLFGGIKIIRSNSESNNTKQDVFFENRKI